MQPIRFISSLAEALPRRATQWIYLCLYVVVFLLGVVFVQRGGAVWVSVGTSLVAAGIAGWVLFLHVWISESRMERLELLRQVGFVGAFSVRSTGIKAQYDTRLRRASTNIDIMGFGLRALRQDYAKDFPVWAARAEVRILLLDPRVPKEDESFADQRDREEGDDPGTIRADVRAFVRAVAPLLRDPNLKFKLRLYRCLPSINLFRIDGELFWGPYLVREASRNLPTFLIDNGGSLFPVLTRHFDAVWSDDQLSQPVPEDWVK